MALDSRTPRALAGFYSRLLDWPVATESDYWVTLRPPEGVGYLAFHLNEHHVRPVWPSQPEAPQQQLHLDFEVTDLAAAVEHAVELGAQPAQFQPQDTVRAMLDPDGHPFCLYT